jgi:hypothetical protein
MANEWGQEVIEEDVGKMNIIVILMSQFGHYATGPKI